jgi:hypothetical protein
MDAIIFRPAPYSNEYYLTEFNPRTKTYTSATLLNGKEGLYNKLPIIGPFKPSGSYTLTGEYIIVLVYKPYHNLLDD